LAALQATLGNKQASDSLYINEVKEGDNTPEGAHTYAPREIGNANPRVLVNPSAVASGSNFFRGAVFMGSRFGPGKIPDTTTGIAAFHEFGHAWTMWQNINAAGNGVIPGANGIDPR
jgi:hypothetical protein